MWIEDRCWVMAQGSGVGTTGGIHRVTHFLRVALKRKSAMAVAHIGIDKANLAHAKKGYGAKEESF